jgi:hypothetical protein
METLFIVNRIQRVFDAKGYKFFTNGDLNVNLIGVRRDTQKPNRFDDFFLVIYKTDGEWTYHWFPCTTDAGLFYLENPIVKQGCALLKEGQYRGAYEIGLHKSKYEALVQRKPVTVYRDNNRDNILDFDAPTETGLFGINIHKGSDFRTKDYAVDKWSAGCQVLESYSDFHSLMRICRLSAQVYGNSFTYTLINERALVECTA